MSLSRRTLSFPFRHLFFLPLLFIFMSGAARAQEGASSAAASRTRYLAEMGSIPASREVAVEEIINYHRHQIGRPKAGEAVNLDLRWGNNSVSPGTREAILQVGLSTALANDRDQLRPLNLSLVIDKSGSMADADKLSRVKAALLVLISQLRETDVLSISVFDSEAQVLWPAQSLSNREAVKRVIRRLEPGSSTNIHAGLMLGYHEALKYYRQDITNRVILLTDGIANQGVTDPDQIARDSLRFNDRGIDLSTIGVGLDLNKDLLRDLAKSGRGLFHFVADAQDIEKVFAKEVQSLVSPVATGPNLEIAYDSDLELVQLYGYEPHERDGEVRLKLDNMNSGLTQVVLLRFKPTRWARDNERLSVRVRLSYFDLEEQRQVVKTEETFLTVKAGGSREPLRDREVGKNYSIALLAQAIREMAMACEARNYHEAEELLANAISRVHERYPHLEDEDISRTLTVARKYQEVLRKQNRDAKRDR